MTTVRESARLHPTTVTAHSSDTDRLPRRARSPQASSDRVRHHRVDERVWALAVAYARRKDLPLRCIQIVSETEVIIRNR